MLDDKSQKTEIRNQEQAERLIEADPSYYQKLAYRVANTICQCPPCFSKIFLCPIKRPPHLIV
jgi:hypothetical protein